MFCIGIVGTYVGKIYNEVKARPRFIIEKTVIDKKEEASVKDKK